MAARFTGKPVMYWTDDEILIAWHNTTLTGIMRNALRNEGQLRGIICPNDLSGIFGDSTK